MLVAYVYLDTSD